MTNCLALFIVPVLLSFLSGFSALVILDQSLALSAAAQQAFSVPFGSFKAAFALRCRVLNGQIYLFFGSEHFSAVVLGFVGG